MNGAAAVATAPAMSNRVACISAAVVAGRPSGDGDEERGHPHERKRIGRRKTREEE